MTLEEHKKEAKKFEETLERIASEFGLTQDDLRALNKPKQ